MAKAVTIDDQLSCVQRELRYRKRVYDRRISEGRMSPQEAARETARMEAVLQTLIAAKEVVAHYRDKDVPSMAFVEAMDMLRESAKPRSSDQGELL